MHIAPKTVQEQELLRLLLTGSTIKECAITLDRSYSTVRNWARDPAFLLALKELSSEIFKRVDEELQSSKATIQAKLEDASEAALERLITMSQEAKNEHVVLKACESLLDRDSRFSKQHRVAVDASHKHTVIDPITLIHAVATAKEQDAFEVKQRGALPPPDAAGGERTS